MKSLNLANNSGKKLCGKNQIPYTSIILTVMLLP